MGCETPVEDADEFGEDEVLFEDWVCSSMLGSNCRGFIIEEAAGREFECDADEYKVFKELCWVEVFALELVVGMLW